MARLSFRCDEELIKRVDAARGDVARERWLRRQIERALDAQPEFVPASTHNALVEAARADEREWMTGYQPEGGPVRRGRVARSSSQAKRDVQPRPKGGK